MSQDIIVAPLVLPLASLIDHRSQDISTALFSEFISDYTLPKNLFPPLPNCFHQQPAYLAISVHKISICFYRQPSPHRDEHIDAEDELT